MTPTERARAREIARRDAEGALSIVRPGMPGVPAALCEAIEHLAIAVRDLADVSESQEAGQ